MGLAITKKIMQKYNGKIKVERDNNWTVFTVYVPK